MNWTRHDTRALIEAAEERPIMSMWSVRAIRSHHGEDGLIERLSRLEDFILTRRPYVWGQSDCSMSIADWVALNGHPDPGAEWRGTYDDENSCAALLERRGGLANHIAACAANAGLQPIHEPELGCIAVIGSQHDQKRQWSAIWNGFRWLVKWGGGDGWVPFAAKPIAMWRV
ncbi:hypothetical protein [Devosia sp. 2618]|uniref:DUF6950 family protein n=1 Tax=Devosia sp. 2618 TaxID=3156454 RepID=UPI003390BFDB